MKIIMKIRKTDFNDCDTYSIMNMMNQFVDMNGNKNKNENENENENENINVRTVGL
jgi:hypothetical protein